jgi:hypothetical protein
MDVDVVVCLCTVCPCVFTECMDDTVVSFPSTPAAYLAQHYGRALKHLFNKRDHSHVIICEDDMVFGRLSVVLLCETICELALMFSFPNVCVCVCVCVAVDFLTLFEKTHHLLDVDPTLMCVRYVFFPSCVESA